MKLSYYTIIVDDYPNKGESLVYNTRTQALIKLDRGLSEAIKNLSEQTQQRYREEIKLLHNNGILVLDEEEENRRIEDFFHQLKEGIRKASFPVSVLTTYACNFDCEYCFQKSSRVNEAMSKDTAYALIEWVEARVLRLGYEEVYIVFYGGEPLLNTSVIDIIASKMNKFCRSKGLKFRFMLQTNGYLLNREHVEKYLPLGLSQVRISVDGVGYAHDRNRHLPDGTPTFDRIMDNIVACVDDVSIGISCSYENGDITHIEELLDYLDDIGILYKLGEFMFSPIHPSLGPSGHAQDICQCEHMNNYAEGSLINAVYQIRKLMAEKRLPMRSGLSIVACPLTRRYGGVTIDQRGRIFKCNSMLGHPEFSVGNIWENSFNKTHEDFLNLDVWEKCPRSCPYLPMCSGGCRMFSFLKNRSFSTPVCFKSYLDALAPEFIKWDYNAINSNGS